MRKGVTDLASSRNETLGTLKSTVDVAPIPDARQSCNVNNGVRSHDNVINSLYSRNVPDIG